MPETSPVCGSRQMLQGLLVSSATMLRTVELGCNPAASNAEQ
jgi:hypothetical protein